MISLFASRALVKQTNKVTTPSLFFMKTFFEELAPTDKQYIDVVIKDGKRTLAPFVSPRSEGKVVKSQGKTVASYKPAYIKQKFITEAADILETTGGNVFYADDLTPQQRATIKLTEELQEHKEMGERRTEWMCASALTTGKIIMKGEDTDEEVDFGLPADHMVTLTGTALFTDPASKPLEYMRQRRRKIIKDSGVTPTHVVFGEDVIDAFLAHADVKATLDTRRISMGVIDPKAFPDGTTYYGYLNELGMEIWGYNDWYIDDADGLEYPMMPADRMLMTSTKGEFIINYGAIKDLKALAAMKFFVKSWEEEDPSARYVLMQSAPLPVPTKVKAIICDKVV